MKLLIQKINNEIRHDFSFTLLESVRFRNWLTHGHDDMKVRYMNTETNDENEIQPFEFKNYHRTYIPIGSVEFVTQFLEVFHGVTPKPINVPESLFPYANRGIFNGEEKDVTVPNGKVFVKSNDKIKGFIGQFYENRANETEIDDVPKGNYQISDYINIDSDGECLSIKEEWKVYNIM